MKTHEKPLKVIFGRSLWQLATLRQEYMKLGYMVILDSFKGIVEVYPKQTKEEKYEMLRNLEYSFWNY